MTTSAPVVIVLTASALVGGGRSGDAGAPTPTAAHAPAAPPFGGEYGATGTVSGELTWPGLPDNKSLAIRLTAAGTLPVWKDLSVAVSAGERTVLDLTPANAGVSPAEFPTR